MYLNCLIEAVISTVSYVRTHIAELFAFPLSTGLIEVTFYNILKFAEKMYGSNTLSSVKTLCLV
jgi:hypothetical protein